MEYPECSRQSPRTSCAVYAFWHGRHRPQHLNPQKTVYDSWPSNYPGRASQTCQHLPGHKCCKMNHVHSSTVSIVTRQHVLLLLAETARWYLLHHVPEPARHGKSLVSPAVDPVVVINDCLTCIWVDFLVYSYAAVDCSELQRYSDQTSKYTEKLTTSKQH